MNTNKSIFLSQQIIAMKEADIFNPEIKKRIMDTKIFKTVLPGPFTIYDKEIVKDQAKKMLGNLYFNMGININTNGNMLNSGQPKMINDNCNFNDERSAIEEFSSKSTAAESIISTCEFMGYGSNFKGENDKSNNVNNNECISVNMNDNFTYNNLNNNIVINNFSEIITKQNGSANFNNNIAHIDLNNSNTYSKSNYNCNSFSTPNQLFRSREKSRFNFANENPDLAMFNSGSSINSLNTTQDSQVEIPNFVNDLIYKKVSRFSFFKNFAKDDEDFTYFDRNLIREYTENNPWALFIINNLPNKNKMQTELEDLIEKEKLSFIKKFNSA
jgi:hypothetical protein